MSRPQLHYADQRNDAISLVIDLCHAATRHDCVWSNPGTKAEAYSYRQRIYRWRRRVLAILAHLDGPEARQCLEDLLPLMGRRFNKDWLDYTRFDIEPPTDLANREGWRVKGSVGRVMYGPDIVFADTVDQDQVDDMRALLDAAQRNRP